MSLFTLILLRNWCLGPAERCAISTSFLSPSDVRLRTSNGFHTRSSYTQFSLSVPLMAVVSSRPSQDEMCLNSYRITFSLTSTNKSQSLNATTSFLWIYLLCFSILFSCFVLVSCTLIDECEQLGAITNGLRGRPQQPYGDFTLLYHYLTNPYFSLDHFTTYHFL